MKETKTIAGYLTDEYGNVLNEVYHGDRLVRKEQDEYKRTHKINFKKGDDFVKVFTDLIPYLYEDLTIREYAITMAIPYFISYNDGILRCNRVGIDIKELADFFNESYDVTRRIISSLQKKGIIGRITRQSDTYKNKTKNYLVANPYIYLRGSDIDSEICELFINTKWANL